MHELTIARAIVEGAAAEAHRRGVATVRRVRCRVGVLRQIDPALLREAFEIARSGTACDAAALDVDCAAMQATCCGCGGAFEIAGWDWACPACGGERLDLCGGDELEIVGICIDERDGLATKHYEKDAVEVSTHERDSAPVAAGTGRQTND